MLKGIVRQEEGWLFIMATKSIQKMVQFKSKSDANRFVDAIEKSALITSRKIELSKPCEEVRGTDIKKYLDRF